MFSTEICKLPAAGSDVALLVAAVLLFVAGVGIKKFVEISARNLSVISVVPVLLMSMIGAMSVNEPCVLFPAES